MIFRVFYHYLLPVILYYDMPIGLRDPKKGLKKVLKSVKNVTFCVHFLIKTFSYVFDLKKLSKIGRGVDFDDFCRFFVIFCHFFDLFWGSRGGPPGGPIP